MAVRELVVLGAWLEDWWKLGSGLVWGWLIGADGGWLYWRRLIRSLGGWNGIGMVLMAAGRGLSRV